MNQLALIFPGSETIEESGVGASFAFIGKTPANIINTIIPVIFVLAALILLIMLIFGGFTIFVSAGNPEKIKKGTGMITSALIGFLIIFAAYWIIQLLELTFGINILGTPPTPPIPLPTCPRPPCPFIPI